MSLTSHTPKGKRTTAVRQATGRPQDSLLKQHMVKVYHLHPINSVYRFKPDPTSPSSGESQASPSRRWPFTYSITSSNCLAQLQHPASGIQSVQGATVYWIVCCIHSQGHLLGQVFTTKTNKKNPSPVKLPQPYIMIKGYSFEAQQEGETVGDIT